MSDHESPNQLSWYHSKFGVLLILCYSAIGLTALLLVSGVLYPRLIGIEIRSVMYDNPFVTPIHLYLFALLGALSYIFSSLTKRPDAAPLGVFHLGLRIPAALLVTTGIFLFVGTFGIELQDGGAGAERTLAGMAFLIGLFVDHALRSLRAISSRLYPGEPRNLYAEESTGAGNRRD